MARRALSISVEGDRIAVTDLGSGQREERVNLIVFVREPRSLKIIAVGESIDAARATHPDAWRESEEQLVASAIFGPTPGTDFAIGPFVRYVVARASRGLMRSRVDHLELRWKELDASPEGRRAAVQQLLSRRARTVSVNGRTERGSPVTAPRPPPGPAVHRVSRRIGPAAGVIALAAFALLPAVAQVWYRPERPTLALLLIAMGLLASVSTLLSVLGPAVVIRPGEIELTEDPWSSPLRAPLEVASVTLLEAGFGGTCAALFVSDRLVILDSRTHTGTEELLSHLHPIAWNWRGLPPSAATLPATAREGSVGALASFLQPRGLSEQTHNAYAALVCLHLLGVLGLGRVLGLDWLVPIMVAAAVLLALPSFVARPSARLVGDELRLRPMGLLRGPIRIQRGALKSVLPLRHASLGVRLELVDGTVLRCELPFPDLGWLRRRLEAKADVAAAALERWRRGG